MRTIKPTKRFKQDYKQVVKGRHGEIVAMEFNELVEILANDIPLKPKFRDHQLTGEWRNHRDCHVRPDLVLIYRKLGDTTLQLVRLALHAELGW